MVALSIYIIITKPDDWFLMESYWGFNISLFSNFASLMAFYYSWWHSAAVFSSEIAWGFNVMIVPAYWAFEYKNFIRDYANQSADENIMYLVAATVHSTPIICTIIELVYTKFVFLKSDSKYCFYFAMVYIPVNYLGGKYIYHKPVYYQSSLLNWSRPWVTLGIWIGQAFCQYGINWITASYIQHI